MAAAVRFPAHLAVYAGGKAVAMASVWFYPVWQALGLLALLLGLVLLAVLLRRRRNRLIEREVSRRTTAAHTL